MAVGWLHDGDGDGGVVVMKMKGELRRVRKLLKFRFRNVPLTLSQRKTKSRFKKNNILLVCAISPVRVRGFRK